MAQLHNAIKNAPDIIEGARRALSAGEEFNLERGSETLGIPYDIFDIHNHTELQFLRRVQLRCSSVSVGAVALSNATSGLVNPANSNKIVVVEDLTAYNVAALDTIYFGSATETVIRALVAFAQLNSFTNGRDPRNVESSGGFLQDNVYLFTAQPVGVLGTINERQISGNQIGMAEARQTPCVIPPGFGIFCQAGTVNNQLYFNVSWRSRPLRRGELT